MGRLMKRLSPAAQTRVNEAADRIIKKMTDEKLAKMQQFQVPTLRSPEPRLRASSACTTSETESMELAWWVDQKLRKLWPEGGAHLDAATKYEETFGHGIPATVSKSDFLGGPTELLAQAKRMDEAVANGKPIPEWVEQTPPMMNGFPLILL